MPGVDNDAAQGARQKIVFSAPAGSALPAAASTKFKAPQNAGGVKNQPAPSQQGKKRGPGPDPGAVERKLNLSLDELAALRKKEVGCAMADPDAWCMVGAWTLITYVHVPAVLSMRAFHAGGCRCS